MKTLKYLTLLLIFFSISCDLEEDDLPFLDETVFLDADGAEAIRDGIYQALTTYSSQERRIYVENLSGGIIYTSRGGNVNAADQTSINAMKPGYDANAEAMWEGLYVAIHRANKAINNISIDGKSGSELDRLSDAKGHAHFVRAWSYFRLVTLWKEIPLWLEVPTSPEDTHKAVSSESEIYNQIIIDLDSAKNLLNGSAGLGYPKQFAANMLLSKIYMKIATSPELQTEGDQNVYWNKAYNEAKTVYDSNEYGLVSDFSHLFDMYQGGENLIESVFELQISADAANSQMGRNFSPGGWKPSNSFGWFRVSNIFHDYHVQTYGTRKGNGLNGTTVHDLRYPATYMSLYLSKGGWNKGKMARQYPAGGWMGNLGASHPHLFKYTEKDRNSTAQYDSKNIIVMRYAELLLMLAEISNELDKSAEKMTYLNPVLTRAGVDGTNLRPEWAGTKDEFRDAIMDEYKFELVGEGSDHFHARRRGFAYFLQNTIKRNNDKINNNDKTHYYPWKRYGKNGNNTIGILFSEDENEVMKFPIPLKEVLRNNLID